jgi:poly(A) polymerase
MINIKEKLKQFPTAIMLCQLISNEGGQARFVGGSVRDLILNREVSDIDLSTNLSPNKIEDILSKNNINYFSIGKDFGTITAIINKQHIEITTLRKDISCDGRHAVVECTDDWQEDAQRRDFTVNAMSADLDGNIYDYFDGLVDLEQRKVRFIGNAEDRITEDYLRILRFFRFTSYFADNIDEQGLVACAKYANKVQGISISRFRSEMSKIFLSKNALQIIEVMQTNNILPCKYDSVKYLQNLNKVSLKFFCESSEILYLSALLRGFDNPDVIINNSAFKSSESKLLKLLMYSDLQKFDIDSLRENWQKYKHSFQDLVLISLAVKDIDISREIEQSLKRLLATEIIALPICGKDLAKIGINPGKEMGELLAIAEKLWYKSEFKISKEELIFHLENKIL